MSHLLIQYSYLQVLDFLTTLSFLLYGVQEANPVVVWFVENSSSPIIGLLIIKSLAVGLGIIVWRTGRARLLSRINILFAVVVAWNLLAIIAGASRLA